MGIKVTKKPDELTEEDLPGTLTAAWYEDEILLGTVKSTNPDFIKQTLLEAGATQKQIDDLLK